jgi:hypothetical protein
VLSITVVSNAPNCGVTLEDFRGIIYNHNTLIILATGYTLISDIQCVCSKENFKNQTSFQRTYQHWQRWQEAFQNDGDLFVAILNAV